MFESGQKGWCAGALQNKPVRLLRYAGGLRLIWLAKELTFNFAELHAMMVASFSLHLTQPGNRNAFS
jgi:hypothetical protein